MKLPTIDVGTVLGVDLKKERPEQPAQHKDPTGPKEVLFTWQTSNKVQQNERNKRVTRTAAVIGVTIALLLVVMQEYVLILLIASVMFFLYAVKNMPLAQITHEISNHGISFDGQLYTWPELIDFFFSQRGSEFVLVVETEKVFPGRLYFNFPQNEKDKIKTILEKYLKYTEQEPLSFVDKAYKATADKLNLDSKNSV